MLFKFLCNSIKLCLIFALTPVFTIKAPLCYMGSKDEGYSLPGYGRSNFSEEREQESKRDIERELERERIREKERVLVNQFNFPKNQIKLKLESCSKEDIKEIGSTLLFESCSVGSFDTFIEALKKGAEFKYDMKDRLMFLIKARMEMYKIKNLEHNESLLSDCQNLIKCINYLCYISEIMSSNNYFPIELSNIICNYSIPDFKELNELNQPHLLKKSKSSRCIIS